LWDVLNDCGLELLEDISPRLALADDNGSSTVRKLFLLLSFAGLPFNYFEEL
jgi:hypothetical protein